MAVDQQAKLGAADPQVQKAKNFLQETSMELKKTHWPTRQEAWRLTGVVIGVLIGVGIYMGTLDAILGSVFRYFHVGE